MKVVKRILAILGVVLLLGMYGATLFFALSESPKAGDYFKGALACTILIPVMLYGYLLIYRYLKDRKK